MYVYDEFDWAFLEQRVAEFRDQVRRRLAGELTEDEFKLLRLLNGVYLQLHAYMLRIGIPYGTLDRKSTRLNSSHFPYTTLFRSRLKRQASLPCTSTTNSTGPFSSSASPNSATRCGGASRAS